MLYLIILHPKTRILNMGICESILYETFGCFGPYLETHAPKTDEI